MSDLFVAATLFVIVAAGVAAALAGFSMALGAFVAGLLLAETEFRKAIETTIDPFKGLLLGLFFFTVGMNIDFRELAREPSGCLGRRRPCRHQVHHPHRPRPAVSPFLARGDRDGPAARPGRRVRLCRHRHGDNARPDRRQGVELHGRADLADHGADSRTVPRRAAARADGARGQAARSGACRCAERRQRPRHRHRPRPGRTGRLHDAGAAPFQYIAVDNDAAAVPEQRRRGAPSTTAMPPIRSS